MFKIFSISLSLLFALHLTADSGIASDNAPDAAVPAKASAPGSREKALSLFIDALLEKDPDKQCVQLLEVIAADPENAKAPLEAFATVFPKAKEQSARLNDFNKLLAAHPANPLLVLKGAEMNRLCGAPIAQLMKFFAPLLAQKPARLINDPHWSWAFSCYFLNYSAAGMLYSGDHAKLLELFDAWSTAPFPHDLAAFLTIAPKCHTAAARSFCAGNDTLGAAFEKRFNAAVTGIKKSESTIQNQQQALSILTFYRQFGKELKSEEPRFAREFYQRTRSADANIIRMNVAVACGDLELFEQAAAELQLTNPRFDTTEQRFKTLVSGGKYEEARKELERLPEKQHFDLLKLLYVKQKNWSQLYTLLTDRFSKGAPADAASAALLLSVAEKKHSIAIYRQAMQLLKPHLTIPAIANAAGYVGAVLGQDLEQGYRLLLSALKAEPDNFAYLDSIAWVCFKLKRYDEAEKWITKAIAAATPHEGIAVILEHAGDIAAARGKDPGRYYTLALKYASFDDEFEKEAVIKKLKALK